MALRRMLKDDEGPLFEGAESIIMAVVGTSNLDFSDEAGAHVLKALPLGRKTRRRLLRTRWAMHLFSGDGQAPELSVVETDHVTVLTTWTYECLKPPICSRTPSTRFCCGQRDGGKSKGSMEVRRDNILKKVS